MRVDLSRACFNSVRGHLFELRHDFLNNVALDVYRVKVLLKVRVRQLIPRLELPIVITFLLDGIISQMYEPIRDVL